ncbi:MAG: hypothetical protein AB7E55_26215, partial [Pigmentiphaga sp.]
SLRGLETIPCQIVVADRHQQAAAFSAINGQTTSVSRLQLFHAQLASGDPHAIRIRQVCENAGVTVVSSPHSQGDLKPGQIQCVSLIGKLVERNGEATTITTLRALLESNEDDTTLALSSAVIHAMCEILADNPEWREAGLALIEAMDNISIDDVLNEADRVRRETRLGTRAEHIARVLCRLLEDSPALAKINASRETT